MTSEPEQNLPCTPSTPPADSAPGAGPSKQPRPLTGPTLPGNPSEAWDQIRHTAETTTQKLNEFRQHNQSPADLQKTARQFAERGREETGRGLRALAEAAGKLADLVDGTAGTQAQHAQEPPVIESKKPDAGPDRPA
ncbi:hypothetical protein [Microbacterium sp. A93]|uniref:hypothetical protein n=1 Tax=Microbacterium sp. A93 TaxID=3450716 RepID=UPI003F440FED